MNIIIYTKKKYNFNFEFIIFWINVLYYIIERIFLKYWVLKFTFISTYLGIYDFFFHNGDLYNILFDNFGRQLYEYN